MRQNKGFTLVEMIMVVIIIGILASIVVPKFTGKIKETMNTAAKLDIANISTALKMYEMENGNYPTEQQGLKALMEKPTTSPVPQNWRRYLEKDPVDPWQREYKYAYPGKNNTDDFDLWSQGADDKIETDDIVNWKK